jgi:outer membrane protein assembly factor BamB
MPRRLPTRPAAALALGAAILLAPALARAGDWPQWRGPTGLGYTDEKDLPLTWGGKTNENVLWKVDLPKSHNPYSSPVAFKDKVVLTWATNEPLAQHVTCYQASDGKQLWDAVVPPGKLKLTDSRGTYCAGTPAADEAGVYIVFGSAVVAALDWNGNPRWRHDLERVAFDVCAGSSPILYKDTLIYLADMTEKKSSLIAFDRKTGALRWEALRPEMQFAHSTPAIIQVRGKDLMIIAASTAIQGADPASGKVLWWCKNPGDTSSPAYGAGLVYADSGRGGGNPGAAVDPAGSGEVQPKWKSDAIKNDLSSPLIVGDCLYRLASRGLQCIKIATGDILYNEPLQGLSAWVSPFATADGRVYYATAGKSCVLKAGPKFEVLATSDLGDPHFASPAVSGGRIYLRGNRQLFCVGKK